jgi:hypothetical protein
VDIPDDLLDLPCLPESRLPAGLAEQLPDSTPGPPWACRVRAVIWVQRATAPLPQGSRWAGRVRALTLGAVVNYLESPVGPYREVFAGPLLRGSLLPVVHVPFIAVDSLPSVHGGRTHWALPKSVARFAGEVGAGEVTANGEQWSVSVSARQHGPGLPLRGPLGNAQAGRRAGVLLRGRGRLARVRVAADGPSLSGWLGHGTHLGVVAQGRMVVQAPL